MRASITARLRRHADRKDSNKTGLTLKGIRQARAFGARLGPRTKVYYGTATRTTSTGKLIEQKADLRSKPRQRKELTTSALKRVEWEAIVKEHGSKEKATRSWLEGKVSAEVVLPPTIAADKIMRRKLRLAWKLARAGKKGVVFENITHQENQQAVLERLLGISSEALLRGKPIKPLEAITFKFFKEKEGTRVELTFRGKTFDVTRRFEKVISLKKEEEGAPIRGN